MSPLHQFATLNHNRAVMVRQYAAYLSLLSLMAACAAGAIEGSGFIETVRKGLIAMMIFFPLGWFLGELGRQTAEDMAQKDLTQNDLADSSPGLPTDSVTAR